MVASRRGETAKSAPMVAYQQREVTICAPVAVSGESIIAAALCAVRGVAYREAEPDGVLRIGKQSRSKSH
jgi:hypothetical protein